MRMDGRTDGRTDRHDEANSSFSQFCERPLYLIMVLQDLGFYSGECQDCGLLRCAAWDENTMLRSKTRPPSSGTKMETTFSSEILTDLSTYRTCPYVKDCSFNDVLRHKTAQVSAALTSFGSDVFVLGCFAAL